MPETPLWAWGGFLAFVLALLALDLGVFHRKSHAVSLREATLWSAIWIALALVFNAGLWYLRGPQTGVEFLTGYLIEKSLSVDNLFVFALIFSAFAVPAAYQHRVLFWGILGALVMRAIFIFAGAALLEAFHWVIYVFGGFLILTGIRMFAARDAKPDPLNSPLVRLMRRILPVTESLEDGRLVVRRAAGWAVTPLFLVLLLIEVTDLVFAIDSIPAIFAVTRDPFIVFTSNVFAILGLRSLYFLLAGILDRFVYLKLGLAAVLTFVGGKMIVATWVKIPALWSLAVITVLLGSSIAASLVATRGTGRRTLTDGDGA